MNQFNLQIGSKNTQTLFSIPQSNQYQIRGQLIVNPKAKIIQDKIWNNKMVLTDTKTNFIFQQQPKIINQKINPAWTMQNYSPQLIKKYSYLLTSNRFVNGQDLQIKKIVGELKFASTRNPSLFTIINSLYTYTLINLSYGKPIDGLYSYKQALKEKETDCGGFSTLLLSLLQSINIPARLVVGFLINKNFVQSLTSIFDFCSPRFAVEAGPLTFDFLSIHVWVEALLPDKTWFPLDSTIKWRRSRGLTKRQGGFGMVPADRLVISYGQDFQIPTNGKMISVDLLQKPYDLN